MSTPVVAVTKDERHRARDIKGDKDIVRKYEKEILLANSEAHRFAIKYHKDMRNKNFLGCVNN
jgi:excinuclease UvrABC nuclease subunit